MKSWFAVYTKPLREEYANWNLINMGYETLLPISLMAKRGIKKKIPLFPRYLFVNFDPEKQPWWSIKNCRGVTRLVSFHPDGFPTPVPDGFIDEIKLRMDEQGFVKLDILPSRLKPGDRVEISDGPFMGYQGVFLESLKGKDRVLILLNMLRGSSVKLYLSLDLIEKV